MNWDETFWIVDVEGNGATPPEIVELAMVEIRDLAPTGRQRHWLIRPEGPISPIATRIHGITNEDVADAPGFDDISDEVLIWIEAAAIVGHNVKVDLDALRRAMPNWEPVAAIDTIKLAKTIKPGLPSYSLTNLSRSLGLNVAEQEKPMRTGAHSAPYDAALTAVLFAELIRACPLERRSILISECDVIDRQEGLAL